MRSSTGSEVIGWLKELQTILEEGAGHVPQPLLPVHLATLAATLQRKKVSGMEMPEPLAGRAAAMGLWDALNLERPSSCQPRPPPGRYLPITPLSNEAAVGPCASSVADIFVERHETGKGVLRDALYTLAAELIGNAEAHSQAEGALGMVCAQTFPKGNRGQIAIADSGVGIRTTLAQNEALLSRLGNENACAMATEYGVSGKLGRGHSGYGLTLARDLAERYKGTLVVLSNEEAFSLNKGKVRTWTNLQQLFKGTLIVFEWRLDTPLDVTPVYDSWPASGENYELF